MNIKSLTNIFKKKIGRDLFSNKDYGSLYYQCNICGEVNLTQLKNISREVASCKKCQSTVRMRSVVNAVSLALFGKSITLPNFPSVPEKCIIGLSDWDGYAIPLAHKFNYQNTYYHKEPKLDIMSINSEMENTADVLISSDVFEHVAPPVSIAFENSYKLLKPGGTLILTVPYSLAENTIEHFPNLYKYEINKVSGEYLLHNTTKDGHHEVFDNLMFHGGEGETLEMRVFSRFGLVGELEKAGFIDVNILTEPCWEFGIYWHQHWSLPIVAYSKPKF